MNLERDDAMTTILQILEDSSVPDTAVQKHVQQRLIYLQSEPKFVNYLLHILDNHDVRTTSRTLAGLLLKNIALSFFNSISEEQLNDLKRISVNVLQDPSNEIQGAVSSLISTILLKGGIDKWPELIPFLLNTVNSTQCTHCESIVLTLLKICEEYLSIDVDDLDDNIKLMLRTFIDLTNGEHIRVTINCIRILNEALHKYYNRLKEYIDTEIYLKQLINLIDSDNRDLQKSLCQGFLTFLDNKDIVIIPYIQNIITYIIDKSTDSDEEVARQMTEFWLSFGKIPGADELIQNNLYHIVPILIKNMRYSPWELNLLKTSLEDDSYIADRSEDIKPFQKSETFACKTENNGLDDDSCWTLRKCSAASLDLFAVLLKDRLLPFILPNLNETLNSSDVIIKESGILALGAIAEGCCVGLNIYLPQLVPQLINCMSDDHAIIRVIVCWTLSRFTTFLLSPPYESDLMIPALNSILSHILDRNKRVQHAALSAFCIFEEESGLKLVPYADAIIERFLQGFAIYQSRSLLLLYDAIAVFSNAVGPKSSAYASHLLPPLLHQFNFSQTNDHFLAITECLANVIGAMELAFLPYAKIVFDRCISVINESAMAAVQSEFISSEEYEMLDKDPMVGALDLLLSMSATLKSNILDLMVHSDLTQQLYYAMQDDLVQVRQPALGLFGDIVRLCYEPCLADRIHDYIPIVLENLDLQYHAVCNNAAWVIGKLCTTIGIFNLQHYHMDILDRFLNILHNTDCSKTMFQTVAMSLCILGLVMPEQTAPHLNVFARLCCQGLRRSADCEEKDLAFRGLCELAIRNPQAIVKDFIYFCDAAASWNVITQELNIIIKNILLQFMSRAGEENWQKVYIQFPEPLKLRLKELYGF